MLDKYSSGTHDSTHAGSLMVLISFSIFMKNLFTSCANTGTILSSQSLTLLLNSVSCAYCCASVR